MHSQLLPFIGTAILIALTPGADTALVVRNALVAGAPSARRTALPAPTRPPAARAAARPSARGCCATS